MKQFLLIAILLIVCVSCNPMRRLHRTQVLDSTTVDKTEIRKIVSDAIKEQGTLIQTVTEYYPQVIYIRDSTPTGDIENKILVAQPTVKRIIKTEIATNTDRMITTDSTAKNDIATNLKSKTEERVVEKPPASVMAVKWIAIGLVAVLLIIFVIKFRLR